MVWESAFGQAKTSMDAEFQTYCMLDSTSAGVQKQFYRRVFMNNPSIYTDHKADWSGTYTVTGTAIPCKNLQGEKECWIKSDSFQYKQKIISATPGYEHADFWLVELLYLEEKSVNGYGLSTSPILNAPQVIPLAYPYANTYDDAGRFTTDLRRWLDVKGYCYIDDPIGGVSEGTVAEPTGEGTPYTTLRGLRLAISTAGGIQIEGANYSRTPMDRGSQYLYYRAGTTTTFNYICDQPFEILRSESDGAIIYGINKKGEVKWPPFTGLNHKVECGWLNSRWAAADRPSGPQDCYVAPLDTQMCSYYVYIGANETVNKVWINGVNPIPTGYKSDGTGAMNRQVQALADTLNDYIYYKNKFGKVDVNAISSTAAGWKITVKWSELSFDSLETNVQKYYFKKTGCTSQKIYTVSRNELGGILSCTDEQGDRRYLPGSATKIPCNNISDYSDCLNQNRNGDEFITNVTNKIYDLSKYHSWSMVVLSGTATYYGYDQSNTETSTTINTGYSEDRIAETKCKYLSGKVKLTVPSGSTTKISYVW